jgi:hypothetical protein
MSRVRWPSCAIRVPMRHQISCTALSCTLPSAATPISRVQETQGARGRQSTPARATHQVISHSASRTSAMISLTSPSSSQVTSPAIPAERPVRTQATAEQGCGSEVLGSGVMRANNAGCLSRQQNRAGACPAQGERRPRRTNATKIKDDVNAAAEQSRGGRDPCDPDSRARDLTRALNTGPLARSSLLFPTSSVHGRPGCRATPAVEIF